jgi:hypothetical protein
MKTNSLVFGLAVAAFPCFADTSYFLAVPDGWLLADGDTAHVYPFNIAPNFTMRYQQVFNGSDFLIGSREGGYIERIWFRPDSELGTRFNTTFPTIQINLSTTSRGADGLSALFSDNIGANEVVVYAGPLQLSSLGGGITFFDIRIPLAQQFVYDPHAGNLLLDVRLFQGTPTTYFDATEVAGDSVSRVWALDVNSPSGQADTLGLITGFSITPIPEPGGASLVALGLLLSGAWHFWRRRPRDSQADRIGGAYASERVLAFPAHRKEVE